MARKTVEIVEADLSRPEHQQAILALTEMYARDPMGNDGPLPVEVRERLISGLRDHPTTLVLLAYLDGQAVGIATCFRGFSTFLARPLINLHDVAVAPALRGQGVGRRLLAAVEEKARQLGCGRLTLEVQEGNARARRLYERAGFAQGAYSESAGGSLFYMKRL